MFSSCPSTSSGDIKMCHTYIKAISYNAWQCTIHIGMKFWCIQKYVECILEHPGCLLSWP